MEWIVWFRAISAIALVALLLLGLYFGLRMLSQGRLLTIGRGRLVSVVESTFVAQNISVHVVKVGPQYLLIGSSANHIGLISEIPADVAEPFIQAQREALAVHAARIGSLFRRPK